MYSAIFKNKLNTVILISVFIIITSLIAYFLSIYLKNILIFVVVGLLAIIYSIVQYFSADKIAILSSGAVLCLREQAPELHQIVENICITAGINTPKIYIINDSAMNAFATGRDPAHAVIAVTSGLLSNLNKAELEGVIAHEVAHIKNYDIRLNMMIYGLVLFLGILADNISMLLLFGRRDKNSSPYLMVFTFLAVLLAPIVASIVQLAVSRQREYLADATGVMLTRYPEGLASALHKISNISEPVKKQNSSMAHLWISSPLRKTSISGLFMTHPPIAKRIERILGMGSRF